MFWTILALLLWIALGGFISYYGDLQGSRWGKRKFSLFNRLRPKYTARIITCVTGMFISLMSILTLLAVVPTIRNVILNGERAIDENKRLNATLTADRVRATVTLNEINQRLRLTQSELDGQKQELTEKLAQLQETDKAYQNAQRRNTELLRQQSNLEQTLQHEQAKVAPLLARERTLTRENRKLDAQNQSAGMINTALGKQNEALERKNEEATHIQSNLTASNESLRARESTLKNNIAVLERANETQIAANQQTIHDYEAQQRALQQNIAESKQKIAELEGQQERLMTRLVGAGQTFSEAYSAVRQGRVSIRSGAELARRVIDPHLNTEAVQQQLIALLQEASATATAYRAGQGDNNRAVRIVTKRLVSQAHMEDADETASIHALAEYLSGGNMPVLVVANALNNTLEGEQALIELTPRPVSQVFDKGSVVAAQKIQGRQPFNKVLDAINHFLQTDVRNAALRAGSVPQVDPITGVPQIGHFELDDLAVLTEQVRRAGGEVTLKAIAATPITSADTLDNARLRFTVERHPGA